MNDTWHILGPGAIGSLFGCHLQMAGLQVHLLGRDPQPDNRNITLQQADQQQEFVFPAATTDTPISQLLVTVKAHQTRAALEAVTPRLGPTSLVVLLQNGMGAWQELASLCPTTPFLLATTTEGAYRPTSRTVVYAGRGETRIGALTPEWQPLAAAVCTQWQPTNLVIHEDSHIFSRLWQKLAINCAINPLTVLYDCPNGELLQRPEALALMQGICEEVALVMSSVLREPAPALFEIARAVTAKTAANVSSMLQDARQGRSTELDYITGYLLREADRIGLPCPINRSVYQRVRLATLRQ